MATKAVLKWIEGNGASGAKRLDLDAHIYSSHLSKNTNLGRRQKMVDENPFLSILWCVVQRFRFCITALH